MYEVLSTASRWVPMGIAWLRSESTSTRHPTTTVCPASTSTAALCTRDKRRQGTCYRAPRVGYAGVCAVHDMHAVQDGVHSSTQTTASI